MTASQLPPQRPDWGPTPERHWPWQRLSFSIIAAMLLMSVVMALSMLLISNYSVQRQFAQLPPQVRAEFEERQNQLPKPQPSAAPPETLRPAPAPAAGPRLSRAERVRRDLINNLSWAIAISGLLAVLMGALLARAIARPVDEVSKAARLVSSGDLSARAPVLRSNIEMVNLTRDFNGMAQSLETLERERRDMIADIAHELRTPLAVVQARLDAYQDGVLDPTPPELALVSTQVELLTRLVSDLRTLSLADAGRLELRLAPLDLSALAGRITASFESKARESNITLQPQLWREHLPIQADRDRLGQVLVNLLENAVRYTPRGGHVTVQARQEGQHAVLCVRDSGPGFPAGSSAKLFDRFYRAEASRSREAGGSGLGLAIVAALIHAHGGEVSARNGVPHGAEVELRLPLLPEAPLPAPAHPA